MLDTPSIAIELGFIKLTGNAMTGVVAVVIVVALLVLVSRIKA